MDNKTIPVISIVGNLETYMADKEYDKAKEHINKWIKEAHDCGDYMGELACRNEAMMMYAQLNCKDEALENADAAIEILNNPDYNTKNGRSTVSLNAANIYRRYNCKDKALFLYIQSMETYEKQFHPDDPRLANMYNNIALNISKLGEFAAALDLYNKALEIISQKKEGELEQALTHINIAHMFRMQNNDDNKELVNEHIETAKKLIDTPALTRDSYYALVCEKCASGFEYLGRPDYQKELLARASRIHAMESRKK